MNRVYPAIIHEEEGSYWVEFPDLEGCNSIGDSLEECMVNAEEALGGYLAVLLENGDEIPKASRLEKIRTKSGIKSYICVDVNKYHKDTRAVKKMLSIPAWLAKEAEIRNYSLSKILQDTLIEKIDIA